HVLYCTDVADQDCKKILNTFKRAFVSKNPCNITKEDYEPLVQLVTQTLPCNKVTALTLLVLRNHPMDVGKPGVRVFIHQWGSSGLTLFWSKSKHLAHEYTWIQGKIFTLEDTLLGYIADDLMWCGDPSTSDMNYDSCPHWSENCPNNPVSLFWKVISQKLILHTLFNGIAEWRIMMDFFFKFAEAACGVVQVMLNGSLSEPFYKNSTFGSVEVFNLDPNKVHKLQAWVMHDIEADSSNSCSGSSINELKLIVEKRNIAFACQDNYSTEFSSEYCLNCSTEVLHTSTGYYSG
ncbi:ADP-ribosyl cyclase 1-like protein, partial [Cricetulus griseus]